MPYLPIEFQDPKLFNIIRDSLGTFLKVTLETELKSTTSMDTICVEMDMGQGILENVIMIEVGDHSFMQELDYKNVPFKFSHCIVQISWSLEDQLSHL